MKERIIMVVFILILGSVLTTALVVVDNFTAPKIKANEEKRLQVNLLKILDIPFDENDENSIKKAFTENVESITKGDLTYYKSKNNDIAFPIAGRMLSPLHLQSNGGRRVDAIISRESNPVEWRSEPRR